MNMIKALLLLALSLSATELIHPPFVIEGEPIPPAVTLNYSYGSNKYHSWVADFYPAVFGKSKRFQISPNIGFMGENNPDINYMPNDFMGLYGGFFASGIIGEKVMWQTYQSMGTFSEDKLSKPDELKYLQLTLAGYLWRPNLLTSLGLLVNSRYGEPVFVPIFRIAYSTDHIVLEGTLPLVASVRWKISDTWHLVGSGKYYVMNYTSERYSTGVEFSRVETMITGERRIKGWVWGTLGLGYAGKSSFIHIPEGDINDIDSGMRMALSLIVRPE